MPKLTDVGKENMTHIYSSETKRVFLTFDDGTSTTVTPQILKTLKDEGVHATFFVTGENIENGGKKAEDLLKQELAEGNRSILSTALYEEIQNNLKKC